MLLGLRVEDWLKSGVLKLLFWFLGGKREKFVLLSFCDKKVVWDWELLKERVGLIMLVVVWLKLVFGLKMVGLEMLFWEYVCCCCCCC